MNEIQYHFLLVYYQRQPNNLTLLLLVSNMFNVHKAQSNKFSPIIAMQVSNIILQLKHLKYVFICNLCT